MNKIKYNCAFCDKLILRGSKSKKNDLLKYCNNQCQANYTKKKWFEENEKKFLDGTLSSRKAIKRFILQKEDNICAICGQLPEHNGKPLTLILDHIDGDASNNLPSNFRLVCPNCDSQLPTFKARNIGNGRATKGMKWFSRL